MLYNPQLETFLHVADAGSFHRAAAESFITASAIEKQINLLEKDIGAELFERSHTGLVLTTAGKSLYINAKKLIQLGKDAAANARKASKSEENVIRIGTSALAPADTIFSYLPKFYDYLPDLKFQLVPFENSLESAQRTLSSLGTDIDVVVGIFDEELLKIRNCAGLVLSTDPICVAVSVTHRLAGRERLSIQDLYGENLYLAKDGWCRNVDQMRKDLKRGHPQIQIKSFDFYNVEIFNRCENSRDVLMAMKKWANVHPLLKIIPVDWPYTLQYGIFHAPQPSKTVRQFLETLQKIVNA